LNTGNAFRHFLKRWAKFIKSPKEPSAIIGVAIYTVFIMFLVALINAGNMAWGVYAGDRLITVAAGAAEANTAIGQLIDENRGDQETLTLLEKIQVKKTRAGGTALAGESLKLALSQALTSRVKGTQVVVNGQAVLAMGGRQEADQLLSRLQAPYTSPDGVTRFAEDVKLVDTLVDKKDLVSVSQALEIVRSGKQKTDTYEVKNGDTLWGIASSVGLTVEQLVALNPGLNPSRLALGETLKLSRIENLINVETVLTKVSTETMDTPLEERKDPSLLLGERRVLAQGKSGKKEVTYQVVLRNGAELERKGISEVVLDKPEPRVVASGTRVLLASRGGGGRLGWPASGGVVSPYGPRDGGMHTGVDISGSTGNPVVAAESGKVVRAGWYSGYGKCVEISHGEGVITRYGHLSSINVDYGQSVDRGELIGRVGSTGYTTGPHLHFEVIINGERVNPMRYL